MGRIFLALSILTMAGSALAGAWDVGSFDNDDALDWVWELTESDGISIVEDSLQAAAGSSSYLDAPTASMAIAAAEVVAALRGNPRPGLPEEVAAWVQANPVQVGDRLLSVARAAIKNIKNLESSELAQLWSDSEDMAAAWRADLDNLQRRLR